MAQSQSVNKMSILFVSFVNIDWQEQDRLFVYILALDHLHCPTSKLHDEKSYLFIDDKIKC